MAGGQLCAKCHADLRTTEFVRFSLATIPAGAPIKRSYINAADVCMRCASSVRDRFPTFAEGIVSMHAADPRIVVVATPFIPPPDNNDYLNDFATCAARVETLIRFKEAQSAVLLDGTVYVDHDSSMIKQSYAEVACSLEVARDILENYFVDNSLVSIDMPMPYQKNSKTANIYATYMPNMEACYAYIRAATGALGMIEPITFDRESGTLTIRNCA